MFRFLRRHPTVRDDAEWLALAETLDRTVAAASGDRPPAGDAYEEVMRAWMADGLSPEEWAARHAQGVMCWSGSQYAYADPALDAWIRRLAAIFETRGALDVCRRHFLTAAEIRDVLREAEEF